MFGVELIEGGVWAGTVPGLNGSLNFRPLDGTKVYEHVGLMSRPMKTFSVFIDWQKYTIAGLYQLTGQNIQGWAPSYEAEGDASGFRESRATGTWSNVGLIASNATPNLLGTTLGAGLGFSALIHGQVHETGNILSALTGKNVDPAAPWIGPDGKPVTLDGSVEGGDEDNGQAFERCVFVNYRSRKRI